MADGAPARRLGHQQHQAGGHNPRHRQHDQHVLPAVDLDPAEMRHRQRHRQRQQPSGDHQPQRSAQNEAQLQDRKWLRPPARREEVREHRIGPRRMRRPSRADQHASREQGGERHRHAPAGIEQRDQQDPRRQHILARIDIHQPRQRQQHDQIEDHVRRPLQPPDIEVGEVKIAADLLDQQAECRRIEEIEKRGEDDHRQREIGRTRARPGQVIGYRRIGRKRRFHRVFSAHGVQQLGRVGHGLSPLSARGRLRGTPSLFAWQIVCSEYK